MAHYSKGFRELGVTLYQIVTAIKKCDKEVSQKEVEVINEMLRSFADPESLAYKTGANVVLNGVEIYHEMTAAYTNYKLKEYEGFGRDIGVVLALTFIGS
jgi:hypothetical protein